MSRSTLLLFLASLLPHASGLACSESEPVRVGCTKNIGFAACGGEYGRALQDAAAELGLRVSVSAVGHAGNLGRFDALLSPGGHDIHPQFYTQNVTPERRQELLALFDKFGNKHGFLNILGTMRASTYLARDRFELAVLREADEPSNKNIPYLGVCYGMQAMAAHLGVPLFVDITEQLGIPARISVTDEIELGPESALSRYLREPGFSAYKLHHQAVDPGGYWPENLRITATSSHGGKRIVEAMERTDRPSLGVQFHPERSADRPVRLAPYKWLLERACANRKRAGS